MPSSIKSITLLLALPSLVVSLDATSLLTASDIGDGSHRLPTHARQFLSKLKVSHASRPPDGEEGKVGTFHWATWGPTALVAWSIWLSLVLLTYRCCYTREARSKDEVEDVGDTIQRRPSPELELRSGHFNCHTEPAVCFWACCCPALRWADTINAAGLGSFWLFLGLYAIMALLNYMNFFTVVLVAGLGVVAGIYYLYDIILGMNSDSEEEQGTRSTRARIILAIVLIISVIAAYSVWITLRKSLDEQMLNRYMALWGCFTWGLFTTSLMLYYRHKLREMFDLPRGDVKTCMLDGCFIFWCPWLAVAQEARVVKEAHHVGHAAVPAQLDMGTQYGATADVT